MYPGYWAKIHPTKAAAINSFTGETVSYEELNNRSNQLAQLLHYEGLRSGDHISIFMENNLRYYEVIWAALRSGLYITTVNRYLTTDEAAYIVNDSQSKALITSFYLREAADGLPSKLDNCPVRLIVDGELPGYASYQESLDHYPPCTLDAEPEGATMLYSSGSTGKPKGIKRRLPERSVADFPERGLKPFSSHWHWDNSTIYLNTAPNYHSGPMLFSVQSQRMGATVVMMPRFEAAKALKAIEDFGVTHSQWVPTMFTRLLKLSEAERQQYNLSSHKVAVHGSAPCPVSVKHDMIDWWGPILYEFYGATEGVGSTLVTSEEWLKRPGTVGTPVGATIHICDENGAELPPGEVGLIYFEVAKRVSFKYHKDSDKTHKSRHPTHETWIAIGDMGYLDDEGYLFLKDRADFMIISGGVNIYPRESEDALIQHPQVADVVVFGVPNEEMGEEVKAIVQLESPASATGAMEQELITYARERLAHFKCPRSIDFVDQLPRLPTGKISVAALRAKYWTRQ
ncbi:acyl-CoA synthetase [Haliea sp. E1-2-M8]|uniref:acyl-CoA synthetase n=1 Tax=Haliea sp. E1-2-M8 TaxID=3064706 RepID=UPI00271EC4D2|nr:acyl-CoA synthetase [Haliea sp. E1-2-M8]MDO8864014.1 acyl-CoA synthetase [Haliea sp. E1-2-M8]